MNWASQKLQLTFWIIRDAIMIWSGASPFSLAAALSYYTMLSLAPVMVIAIAIAGQVYGPQLVESEIIDQISTASSQEVADVVQSVIENTSQFSNSLVASLISVVILVIGASSAFTLLSDTINIIWGISTQRRRTVWYTLRQRIFGIIMVLGVGFLLLVSLAVSTAVSAMTAFFTDRIPAIAPRLASIDDTWWVIIVLSIIFAAIFKVLAEADNWWKDVWVGGIVTAMLFTLNKSILRIYLLYSTVMAVYGAAGSLVILLIWVYNTGLIIFFGAALSKACATHYGSISDITRFRLMTSPAPPIYGRRPRAMQTGVVRKSLDDDQ